MRADEPSAGVVDDGKDRAEKVDFSDARTAPAASSANGDLAAGHPSGAPRRKSQPLSEAEQVREVNRVLGEFAKLPQRASRDERRGALRLSHEMFSLVDQLYNREGLITLDAWTELRKAARAKKNAWNLKRRQEESEHGDSVSGTRPERKSATDDGREGKKRKKKPAKVEGEDAQDRAVVGWRYIPGNRKKKKKKKAEDGADDDEDFVEIPPDTEVTQQRKRSLRRRKQINYSAQLEESANPAIATLSFVRSTADHLLCVHHTCAVAVIL